MLRITMNKSASGAKKYYCEQYYKEGHGTLGYYAGDDQAIGLWGGKASQALGLTGTINKRDFRFTTSGGSETGIVRKTIRISIKTANINYVRSRSTLNNR